MVLGCIVTICKDFFKNPKVFEKCAVIHVTKENEKGVFEMTDGIGRIFGGNSYGVGGYVPQRNEQPEEKPAQAPVVPKEQPVDPKEVMDFLAANTVLMPKKSETTKPVELSPEVLKRLDVAMENFGMYYEIVEKEFGPEVAPKVMDLISERMMNF